MTAPAPWQFALLALGTYRLWRILAIDDMPWLVRARNRLVGAREVAGVWRFDRPALAHMWSCSWCLGWWLSLAVTGLWWAFPTIVVVAAAPFAVASAVGALGHHLNPE